MNLEKIKKLNIPKGPGCYMFKNKKGDIIYIGKASDLRNRVFSYWQKSANHSPAKNLMVKEAEKAEWLETDSEIEALLLEANLIKKHQPYYNILLRDDKRFSYIKISTEDEIPGVFATKKIDKSGKYFGPFTSGLAVRETIKTIRKIWPFCTERKLKKKPCFYYQINRCLGVCGEVIGRKEYKEKIIKPIGMFLSGKKMSVIKNYELRIKELENTNTQKHKNTQEIILLKNQLRNIKYVLEHTKILSLGEKYAADVVELAKVLGLPKVPERIEGYDISNIFGREAVGSMVVFSDGEPNKSEYRKFKIKIGQGQASDVRMLKEVLERRLNRADKAKKGREAWMLPDLIIVDGGKAQLNVALRILKRAKLDIPVLAVSKGKGLRTSQAPDKIFFPGEKKPLELPLASPALHIIKRVRDEAHRFAISYHRLLRKKKWLK
ncbi:MAG: excinuclease ABC subunit UvrC [Patescibacteria group bacterium]